MRNPRPCKICGSPKDRHVYHPDAYVPAKRTEPLRAKRMPQRASGHYLHRRLDEMEPPPLTREDVEQIVMDTLHRFAPIGGF